MNKVLIILIMVYGAYANNVNKLQESFHNEVILKSIKATNQDINKLLINHMKRTSLSSSNISNIEKLIRNTLKEKNITNDEFFSIVDLDKQIYIVVLYTKNDNKINIIGSQLIASGNKDREVEISYGEDHYFDTPIGTYEVKEAWRSDGKFKEDNITQSYGSKDRFIYYFGKMVVKRWNGFDKNGNKLKDFKDYFLIKDYLNFAIHSYNSPEKIGIKNSHGCVRLSDELNLYLEENLVLHKNLYTKDNNWKPKYSFEPKKINDINLKGSLILIVNSL